MYGAYHRGSESLPVCPVYLIQHGMLGLLPATACLPLHCPKTVRLLALCQLYSYGFWISYAPRPAMNLG